MASKIKMSTDFLRGQNSSYFNTKTILKKALLDMKPFKAPRPNGYQPYFYQSQWQVVEGSICKFTRQIFEVEINIAAINQSFLVLISKIPHPEFLPQFRSIETASIQVKLIKASLLREVFDNEILFPRIFLCCAYNGCLISFTRQRSWVRENPLKLASSSSRVSFMLCW